MCKVVVLLSSYNGERYIREQIDSILVQKGVNVHLIVRDDGSTDGTLDILREYERAGRLELWEESNIGVQRSFVKLIDNAPNSDYYALADQDDVWYEDKLVSAVSMLKGYLQSIPLLYGANQNYVDAKLKDLGHRSSFDSTKKMCLERVVLGNQIPGCTMVFNRKLMHMLRRDCNLRKIALGRMHDVWLLVVTMLHGKFIYDDRPCMKYRRHGNNVTTLSFSLWSKLKNRFLNFGKLIVCADKKKHCTSDSAKIILEKADEYLSESEKEHLSIIANYRKGNLEKMKFLFSFGLLQFSHQSLTVTMLKIVFEAY